MLSEVKNRVRKSGQSPGTPIYTGSKTQKTVITLANFNAEHCDVVVGNHVNDLLSPQKSSGNSWFNVEGLSDVDQIKQLADRFVIHPLTVEDILNVDQRPKVEEFENYLFLTFKILYWHPKSHTFSIEQASIIFGKKFILSFLETDSALFDPILEKLKTTTNQRLRQQSVDYLGYRLIDAIVDEYFVVLEGLGEQIESIEQKIVTNPTRQNAKIMYRLKRQVLLLRKAIWPMREAVSHLQHVEDNLISKFTRVYLRDVYDHTMQAIDTIETFRDMLSSMLDMYLSGLTIRMNEIMKTLTIITTIFIPITALASIYGMNLPNIPFMKSDFGFYIVAALMVISIVGMIFYFRKKKWI